MARALFVPIWFLLATQAGPVLAGTAVDKFNVAFSGNGQPMKAGDVVDTLNLVSAQHNARYQIAMGRIEAAEKLGPYAVRLHVKTSYALAFEMLVGNLR